MFQGTILFNQDIGNWDVSNVVNMDAMFQQAETFNQDLSEWCVIKIPTKPVDFDTGALSWVLPQPNWGTCINGLLRNVLLIGSNVLSLNSTNALTLDGEVIEEDDGIRFYLDTNGITIKLKDGYEAGTKGLLEGDTSGTIYEAVDNSMLTAMNPQTDDYTIICTTLVTRMSNTFAFTETFNQSIQSWDVSNVTDMSKIFYEAKGFKQDISIWCVKNIPSKPPYFCFNSPLDDLPYNLPKWGYDCQQDNSVFDNIHAILYGSTTAIPTNSDEVLALSNSIDNDKNNITLNTGTVNTIYVVAIPSYINSSEYLIAEDSFNKIKLKYNFINFVDVLFFGNVVEYRIYKLEIDNPYPEDSKHDIAL
jgi:hypothetical protein